MSTRLVRPRNLFPMEPPADVHAAGTALTQSLESAGLKVAYVRFNGEASADEIARVRDVGTQNKVIHSIILLATPLSDRFPQG